MTFLSSVPTLLIDSSSKNTFALASAICCLPVLVRFPTNPTSSVAGSYPLDSHSAIAAPSVTNECQFRKAQYPRICLRKTYIREISPAATQQLAPRSGPLERLADLAHEVPGRERLRDVEVGANRQPLADLRVTPLCGQHDD